MMKQQHLAIPAHIEQQIYLIRGLRVMLDMDLAKLYGIQTFNLNKAVQRNKERFPKRFAFQVTLAEFANMK
jgi:hypothetical protein